MVKEEWTNFFITKKDIRRRRLRISIFSFDIEWEKNFVIKFAEINNYIWVWRMLKLKIIYQRINY